jgi:tetratricopeptide (TPR) repeat protein
MLTAVVNNISTCLSQQSPPPSKDALALSSAPTDFPVTNAPPRAILLDQARQWAMKAIAHAAAIPSLDKTEECNFGCAVATHNLGEFYEMEGKIEEARQKYEEAASLAKSLAFKEGLVNARAGLKRLKQMEKT